MMSETYNKNTACDTLEEYILVEWPDIQDFMHHPRWDECIFCTEIEGHPCPDSAFMVPKSLFNEIYDERI